MAKKTQKHDLSANCYRAGFSFTDGWEVALLPADEDEDVEFSVLTPVRVVVFNKSREPVFRGLGSDAKDAVDSMTRSIHHPHFGELCDIAEKLYAVLEVIGR